MVLTQCKILCGERMNDTQIVIESIRRLGGFCWDIADRIRKGTAELEDAIRGIAFAQDLSITLTYYEQMGLEGLDDADIFIAKESAIAVRRLSLEYVRNHTD